MHISNQIMKKNYFLPDISPSSFPLLRMTGATLCSMRTSIEETLPSLMPCLCHGGEFGKTGTIHAHVK